MLISLGENCLPSHYFKIIGLNQETNLFDNCRSNIEYLIQIMDDIDQLVNKDNLYLKVVEKKRVVTKNKLYFNNYNIYCPYHMDQYEFTHHDLINNKDHYDSFCRKVERFKNLGSNIMFVYNYKYNENNNITMLTNLVKIFLNKVKGRCCIIYQVISSESSFYDITYDGNIIIVKFTSKEPWINDNWNRETDKEMLVELFKKLSLI